MSEPLIAARNLGMRYGARWLFRAVEFELRPGDRLLVTGPNGCGKSTLLRILAGLLTPREGEVARRRPARFGVGYSALDQHLYPTLTVAEHLHLAADLRGGEARKEELLARVGLAEAGALESQRCSTGMRARLRMALAVQHRPDVLLLDEPGASLDPAGRALVAELVAQQASQGAVIIATNDPEEHALGTYQLDLRA